MTTGETTALSRHHAVWRISAAAALLGLGQNGFLVALPMLVAQSSLDLKTWAGLLLLGSMLFVVGSPYWGRVSDRRGSRRVVVQALGGYAISFTLVAGALAASVAGRLEGLTLIGVIAAARLLYGLTVSGMVPGCQRWVVVLEGDHHRARALAAVSAGLSAGRLLGPLVAAVSLNLSLYAPFVIMVLAAALAMALVLSVDDPRHGHQEHSSAIRRNRLPPPGVLPYVVVALGMAVTLSLMQLGLPDALQRVLAASPDRASHLMGVLLSLGALGSLVVQLGVVRRLRLPWMWLIMAGVGVATPGMALLVMAGSMVSFALGTVMTSIGIALVVPGYTTRVGQLQGQGAGSGLMAMMHTLGYGLATAIVALAPSRILLLLALMACGVSIAMIRPILRDAHRVSGRSTDR